MRSERIRAILFDMDGVLVDAREWHYAALNMALAGFGLNISRADHLARFDGLPTSHKLHRMSAEQGLHPDLHGVISELKQQYTRELIQRHCRPDADHQLALMQLAQAGFRMAVCSNSIRSTVKLMLDKADVVRHVEFFLSHQDVAHPKPAPDIYLAAAARMGLAPGQCLVVEDNQHGVDAARAAGAHVLQVSGVQEVRLHNILRAIDNIQVQVSA